ncbi:hypothetical protein PCASD_05239 [Puccinia coronata f. sp. avenae]|uniref:Uncharacterized protein n=1 Tax=Puccinia coronata f. sp. avenae TaxID=200324 RepID=A0A2N5TH57_9BASI|nr:hypothetical protein PCASD_05239 [Puccinia coronata f. sp. avenae]
MASRFDRLSTTPSSRDPGQPLSASASVPSHLHARPLPPRASSAYPHSAAYLASPAHPYNYPPPTQLHPGLDQNLNMLVHPPRHHSPLPYSMHGLPTQLHSSGRPSMPPSQSHPSLPAFAPRDPRRETLQLHPHLASGQFGQPQQQSRSNRQSRQIDAGMRRSNQPLNLIQSVRDTPLTSRPISMQVDSRRVVTGVLQSALPPSSRPVPVNNTPVRSMSILELENRHKAALQKLQTHSNQRVSSATKPSASSKPSKPPTTRSNNLERQNRHKAAMQKLQANCAPPAPLTQPPAASSSHRQSVKPPPVATTAVKSKPPSSASDATSKSAKATEVAKPAEKSSGSSNPNRRSLFGFLSYNKETSKSGSTAGNENSAPAKLKSPKTSKKQKKEASKKVVDKVEEEDENEEGDEDVPLAQLANRRSSYHPATQLSKSYSLPGMMHRMSSFPETLTATMDRPQHPRALTNPIDYCLSRPVSRQQGNHQVIKEDNESMSSSSKSISVPPPPQVHFRPPPWLDSNFNSFDSSQKNGPRPLIFEDEAKAIRNSKRLWT